MDDEHFCCLPSLKWPGLSLPLHFASMYQELVEPIWVQSPFSSSSLRRSTLPEKVLCHSLTLPKYFLYPIVVCIIIPIFRSASMTDCSSRGRYVLGCCNLPRLGRRAFDYIPSHALCHDSHRCIWLLRVSILFDNFVSLSNH